MYKETNMQIKKAQGQSLAARKWMDTRVVGIVILIAHLVLSTVAGGNRSSGPAPLKIYLLK
jgi:hypothetical protein